MIDLGYAALLTSDEVSLSFEGSIVKIDRYEEPDKFEKVSKAIQDQEELKTIKQIL